MSRIPVDKEMIPYRFTIVLGRAMFTLELHYNASKELFSVNLLRENQLLCAGEKLVYGMPLFEDSYRVGEDPVIRIVPKDEAGQQDRITWDNFGKSVFLVVDDKGGGNGEYTLQPYY